MGHAGLGRAGGACSAILPLDDIGPAVLRLCAGERP